MRNWIDLAENFAFGDIRNVTYLLRDELCRENNKTPQQMNTGQCDEFAEELERRIPTVQSFELGNLYNHDWEGKGEDCGDATGFDLKLLSTHFPQWQLPQDITWEQAFNECGLSWTGTHIWAYDSQTKLCFDIEDVDGVANVFDLRFFRRIFDHYRGQRHA